MMREQNEDVGKLKRHGDGEDGTDELVGGELRCRFTPL